MSEASNELRVLESDKEGSFVVLREDLLSHKALAAVEKSFKKAGVSLGERKKEACSLLIDMNLGKLAESVKKANKLHLDVFYPAKPHKPGIPFRVIVT